MYLTELINNLLIFGWIPRKLKNFLATSGIHIYMVQKVVFKQPLHHDNYQNNYSYYLRTDKSTLYVLIK